MWLKMLEWDNSFKSWLHTFECVDLQSVFHLEPGLLLFYIKTIWCLLYEGQKPPDVISVSARNYFKRNITSWSKGKHDRGTEILLVPKRTVLCYQKKKFLPKVWNFQNTLLLYQNNILVPHSVLVLRYFENFRLSGESAFLPSDC